MLTEKIIHYDFENIKYKEKTRHMKQKEFEKGGFNS
jgi:hypothetical protein